MNSPKNTSIYLTLKIQITDLKKFLQVKYQRISKTELQSIRLHKNNVRQSILGFGGALRKHLQVFMINLIKIKMKLLKHTLGKVGINTIWAELT